jgi:DNA-binding transcriptional ArsR family regulator
MTAGSSGSASSGFWMTRERTDVVPVDIVRKLRDNIRIMRTSPLLKPLLTPTVQGVLAATVLRPEREWYLSDLASHLEVRPSTLQRVVAELADAGILTRRQDGNRVYYRADRECPIFRELSSILAKTSGIADVVRDALAPLARRIRLAFIHGSIAEGREGTGSDVDVILVGDAPASDVALALRAARERLGREVNVTRYSADEFAAKVAERSHFLSSVLTKPRIWLIGNERDVEQIAGGPPGRSGAIGQAGA